MLAQACGARKISKTLQDQSPTDCCGANISSYRFVQFGGCDLGCCRQSVRPSCGATCLFRHAVSDDMEPLDRRPFGFKGKRFIYCQLCRDESVKVGRDGVLGGCIHGDMPENTPLFDVLCLGQDHLMDFSGAALEQPVDNRSRASHAKFHLERRCTTGNQRIASLAWPRWLYCLAAILHHLATSRC